jgi:hypothetical protein
LVLCSARAGDPADDSRAPDRNGTATRGGTFVKVGIPREVKDQQR